MYAPIAALLADTFGSAVPRDEAIVSMLPLKGSLSREPRVGEMWSFEMLSLP